MAKDSNEIDSLVNAGHKWISKEESRRHPQLNLYGEEHEACDREREEVRRVLSQVSNILLNGCDLILDRTFDRIGVPQACKGPFGISNEQGSYGGISEKPL